MRGPEEKPLSLAGPRVCTSCTPEVTAAVPYSGALESKLCIVSGSPRNAVYLVLGPTARSTQLVPQPLVGLPGSCPGLVLPLESGVFIHSPGKERGLGGQIHPPRGVGALRFYWIVIGLKRSGVLSCGSGLSGRCNRGCSLFQGYVPPVAAGSR